MNLSYVISTQPTRFAAVSLAQDFEATVAHIAELGYDGVELAVRDPGLLDASSIKSILDRHNLHVPALGTGQAHVEEGLSFTDPDASIRERALARIESHIKLANNLGTASGAKQPLSAPSETASSQSPERLITSKQTGEPLVIIGLIRGKIAGTEQNQLLQDSLKRVSRIASESNVRLAIEPINRYETNLLNTIAQTVALIEQIKSDNLGILFDTFHANIEEPSIEGSLRACGARLFHVHVADSNRWAPGYGHTDFARIISTLREMKYNSWVSAEILQQPDAERAMRTAIKTMRELQSKI